MATHSRGPWTLQPLTGSPNGNVGVRASGEHVSGYVAFVDTRWPHPEQQEEQIANALLISASPELLDALDKILSIVSYINVHGVGEQPEPTPEIGPQATRCPPSEFWRLFQQIGKLSSQALAKASYESADAKLATLRAALG